MEDKPILITEHPSSLGQMYNNWFVDYASYVILERAIPHIDDGLKPVQRRILHALYELDDGRYNKAANVIGHTMKYHPHGDMAIGDALVQLGQKNLLLDTQGNWGDPVSGDSAAAPRYIEVRINAFCKEILFNSSLTKYVPSYDGRSQEPVIIPAKFPLLLAQGVDGIAVGLSSKILPHNFNELIDAAVALLQGKPFQLLPDFPSGGTVDCMEYMAGKRGSKIRVRSKITIKGKNTVIIEEIPFGTTCQSVIASIITANEKGKLKITSVEDSTAEKVEIHVHVPWGTDMDKFIAALYVFTECEISLSPAACVIRNNKPEFLNVHEILEHSVNTTKSLLERELRLKLSDLEQQLHRANIERIFIENRLYKQIEHIKEELLLVETVIKSFSTYCLSLARALTEEDAKYLLRLPIQRISAFDSNKADARMKQYVVGINEVKLLLVDIPLYTVNWFKGLKARYGKLFPRKTVIGTFSDIEATEVAMANENLYLNAAEGFAGTLLKQGTLIGKCSNMDLVIYVDSLGNLTVTKVKEKFFVGPNPLFVQVFNKQVQTEYIFTLVYTDGVSKRTYVKKVRIGGITRDKPYPLTLGTEGTKVWYFSAGLTSDKVLYVKLAKAKFLKRLELEYDLGKLEVKGRDSQGNRMTDHEVVKVSD